MQNGKQTLSELQGAWSSASELLAHITFPTNGISISAASPWHHIMLTGACITLSVHATSHAKCATNFICTFIAHWHRSSSSSSSTELQLTTGYDTDRPPPLQCCHDIDAGTITAISLSSVTDIPALLSVLQLTFQVFPVLQCVLLTCCEQFVPVSVCGWQGLA